MLETSSDMIFEPVGEGSLERLLPLPPPDFSDEIPPSAPSDGCIYWKDILPWAVGIAAVGTAGYLSWRLISKHNEIPPSI